MNIVMFTNTFTPHVGGVARSVSSLADGLRERGHEVLVVAPEFPGMPADETNVIRIPALQQFAGTDYSVPIPASKALDEIIDAFSPDVVHSHHPFLLGGSALRLAASRELPILYTYHTRYEHYGHYALQDSPAMMRLALGVTLGYCNLCDAVVAPSQSLETFLHQHQIKVPVEVIPTGVKAEEFAHGDGTRVRHDMAIPADAFVVGHVGRLAPEKNLSYLTQSLIEFLDIRADAHFLVAGGGAEEPRMRQMFADAGLEPRLHMAGVVEGRTLANIYAAMDVFAFASRSETQGLVLAEAMTAGVPVVALDAPGAREIVEDGRNGRLLPSDVGPADFAGALAGVMAQAGPERDAFRKAALQTSKDYSHEISVSRTLELYSRVLARRPFSRQVEHSPWEATMRSLGREWEILGSYAQAVGDVVMSPDLTDRS